MPKRKSSQPLQREKKELKHMKIKKILPKFNFLFIIRKQHTKWISHEKYSAMEEINWLTIEVVTVKVFPILLPLFIIYRDELLENCLENFLSNQTSKSQIIGNRKEEKMEIEKEEELSEKDKIIMKENLIFDLHEKRFKASEIANTFGINTKQVFNILAKKKERKKIL